MESIFHFEMWAVHSVLKNRSKCLTLLASETFLFAMMILFRCFSNSVLLCFQAYIENSHGHHLPLEKKLFYEIMVH